MAGDQSEENAPEVNTENEFLLALGRNMENSSYARSGRARWVAPIQIPLFRTRQAAYRFVGWLLFMAEELPEEENAHSLDQITEAIKRT